MDVGSFGVSVEREDDRSVVRIRGEIDFATAPELHRALSGVVDSGSQDISLDFQEVTFLDSEGLKVLLLAYRMLGDRGGELTIIGCSQFVAKTFEILGLDRYFDVSHKANQPSGDKK